MQNAHYNTYRANAEGEEVINQLAPFIPIFSCFSVTLMDHPLQILSQYFVTFVAKNSMERQVYAYILLTHTTLDIMPALSAKGSCIQNAVIKIIWTPILALNDICVTCAARLSQLGRRRNCT
jgi:nicotinic acid phosphoribosyltransferase